MHEVKRQPPSLGQLPKTLLGKQLQPSIDRASKDITAAIDRQRKVFWAGFISGAVVILSLHYIVKESQER